ncbi:MAG: Rho termination factor N-terminal domain-containing protein, partial [Ilumatobacteraceae bacterium]
MAAEALEQSVLESKDKDQLLAIAKALGVKASARTKKSEIIDQILESTGGSSPASAVAAVAAVAASAAGNGDFPAPPTVNGSNGDGDAPVAVAPPAPPEAPELFAEPPAEWELAAGGA